MGQLEAHYSGLLRDIKAGRLVPVLGGDINLCGRPLTNGRPQPFDCSKGAKPKYPPSTRELASCVLGEALQSSTSEVPAFLRELASRELNIGLPPGVGLAIVCQYIQFVDPDI